MKNTKSIDDFDYYPNSFRNVNKHFYMERSYNKALQARYVFKVLATR